ncbi:MAG: CvpA family protein [Clostridium sp.]|jgi:NADH:ubiquinone oxidoreductase subunit 6 (subunit J)|nr:CvpA family protein [Clostridium sp.]
MDPIKVDFSKKDGGRKKDVVIPPEKAALKIVLSLLCSAVFAGILFYFMLPALNFKSYDLYIYLGAIVASYVVFNALFSNVFGKPEYVPYVKRRAIVPGIIIAVLLVAVGIGYLVSCEFFRASSYSKIISVDTDSNFSEDIEEQTADSFSEIPKLDEDTAAQLAARALGALKDIGSVSQFTIAPENSQINYQGKPYRVVPLQYADIIKWLVNTREGFPGYVMVNMADESTNFVELKDGSIRYSAYEHFNKLLKRHLRFEFPTYLFADATFEVNDDGDPFWICARLDKTIGLFGGTDVIGIVLVDAVSGECIEYSMDQLKDDPNLQWIDRVYDSDLIVQQYNYYGKYQKGFWNSLLGQKDVIKTTDGYNYIAKNDDVWMYTGVTSVTSDQSIIGFVLVNQRTKEADFYNVTGGTEYSAQQAAEGRVMDLGYTATFPLLLNIGGEPTYFLSLKDPKNQIVQQYALINVANYNNNKMGVTGTDLSKCLASYIESLKEKGITVDINPDDVVTPGTNEDKTPDTTKLTASGTIADIRTAVMGGESYYYIKLDSNEAYFAIAASKDEGVVILNRGDSVTVTYSGEGSIINADSIKKN